MIERNVRLLGRHDLAGASGGEGMTLRLEADGRRFLFIAHLHAPDGFSVLDVQTVQDPRIVYQEKSEHDQMRTNSLALFGDVLLITSRAKEHGGTPAGVVVSGVGRPDAPKRIGFFDTSGPDSRGTDPWARLTVRTPASRLARATSTRSPSGTTSST